MAKTTAAPTVIRHGDKKAVRFTTASGVTAVVATGLDPELLLKLRRKLERKLRRHHERFGPPQR